MATPYPANEIKVLSWAEAIRQRLDMYMDVETPNLACVLVMQSLCHAVDETVDGRCSTVSMQVMGDRVSVRYDCGMPLTPDELDPHWTVAEMFLLVMLACSSRKKHIEVGSEFCAIGLGALNAVCSDMVVDIVDAGQRAHLRFERGEGGGPCVLEPSDREDGTCMEFTLDASVLPDTTLSEAVLRTALDDLAQRFPGLSISFSFSA